MINRIDLELESVERDRDDVLEEMAEQYEETPPVELEIERLKEQDKLEDVLVLLDKFLEVGNDERC